MAATDYGSEIKSSMQKKPSPGKGKPYKETKAEAKAEGDTPAEMARDKARGIAEGSPRDETLDMQTMRQSMPMHNVPPDAHHVAAAAGIAHAILGNRGMR
jgi:hypothetical protein